VGPAKRADSFAQNLVFRDKLSQRCLFESHDYRTDAD